MATQDSALNVEPKYPNCLGISSLLDSMEKRAETSQLITKPFLLLTSLDGWAEVETACWLLYRFWLKKLLLQQDSHAHKWDNLA